MEQVSLKGGPVWGGLADSSTIAPGKGKFTTLSGCVISRDGTEIERAPGFVLAGQPMGLERLRVRFARTGSTTLVDFGRTLQFGTLMGHGLGSSGTTEVYVHLRYTTSNGQIATVAGSYTATISDELRLILPIDSSSWTKILLDSNVFVKRISVWHALKNVRGRPVIVGETTIQNNNSRTPSPMRAVATFIGEEPMDYTDSGFFPSALVSNNAWSEWEDYRWTYWGNPNNTDTGLNSEFPLLFNRPESYRQEFFDAPARRKVNAHAVDGDLVIAVPGQGQCLVASISGFRNEDEIVARTRLMGIPKGRVFNYSVVISQLIPFPGAVPLEVGKTVHFAIGFRDRFTGSVGLPSEIFALTPTESNSYVRIGLVTARFEMPEAWGLSMVVYTSGPGGSPTAGFYPCYEIVPRDDFALDSVFIDKTRAEDTKWDQKPRFPRIEQLPTGASCAETVRGVTIYGGDISSEGNPDFEEMEISTRAKESEDSSSLFSVSGEVSNNTPNAQPSFGKRSGAWRLSSAYQGSKMIIPNASWTTSLVTKSKVRIAKATLDPSGSATTATAFFFEFEDAVYRNRRGLPVTTKGTLEMNKGQILASEVGRPGITPAPNRILFDSKEGNDTRAIGRMGNSAVVCTKSETYRLAWGRGIRGTSPQIVSDTFGCSAPNSMVEFPGGLAWLSEEGVVVMGQTVAWPGESITQLWDTLVSDSEKMMWQATGVHDLENKRILWAVRRSTDLQETGAAETGPALGDDRYATDDRLSKETNDLIIAFNYETGAFSTIEQRAGFDIVDLEVLPDANGKEQVFALEETGNVYQLGTEFVDHAQSCSEFTSSSTESSGSASFSSASLTTTSVAAGEKMFIRDAAGELEWFGEAAAASTSGAVTLDPTGLNTSSWSSTSVLETRAMVMTMETLFTSFGLDLNKHTPRALAIIHEIEEDGDTLDYLAYARITITNDDDESLYMGGGPTSAEQWGKRLQGKRTIFDTGYIQSDMSKIKIEIVSNCFVKIKDIVLSADIAG